MKFHIHDVKSILFVAPGIYILEYQLLFVIILFLQPIIRPGIYIKLAVINMVSFNYSLYFTCIRN